MKKHLHILLNHSFETIYIIIFFTACILLSTSCRVKKETVKNDIEMTQASDTEKLTTSLYDSTNVKTTIASDIRQTENTSENIAEKYTISETFDENGTLRERVTTGERLGNAATAKQSNIKVQSGTDSINIYQQSEAYEKEHENMVTTDNSTIEIKTQKPPLLGLGLFITLLIAAIFFLLLRIK